MNNMNEFHHGISKRQRLGDSTEQRNFFDFLPNELCIQIFSHLDVWSRLTAEIACRRFLRIIPYTELSVEFDLSQLTSADRLQRAANVLHAKAQRKHFTVSSVTVSYQRTPPAMAVCRQLTEQFLQTLAAICVASQNVRLTCDLQHVAMSRDACSVFFDFRSLRNLECSLDSNKQESIIFIQGLPPLERLHCRGWLPSDLPHTLREFIAEDVRIPNEKLLLYFHQCPRLKALSLISGRSLKCAWHYSNFDSFNSPLLHGLLHFQYVAVLNACPLSYLASMLAIMPSLETLHIRTTLQRNVHLESLSLPPLQRLRELSVSFRCPSFTTVYGPPWSNSAIGVFLKGTQAFALRSFTLHCRSLSEQSAKAICEYFPALVQLTLIAIGDTALRANVLSILLNKLSKLKQLTLLNFVMFMDAYVCLARAPNNLRMVRFDKLINRAFYGCLQKALLSANVSVRENELTLVHDWRALDTDCLADASLLKTYGFILQQS